MNNEEKIISMLQKIMEKQDEHSQKHDNHATQFKEHGQILSALRTGQEYLKAEIDEMKLTNAEENAKKFEDIQEQLDQNSAKQDLLRDEVWQNKVDTHRIKNTMGMK